MKKDRLGKWRDILMNVLLFIMLVICIAELGMYFFLKTSSDTSKSYIQYLTLYVLFPTGINLTIWILGKLFMKSNRYHAIGRNYIILICMLAICFNITYFHKFFPEIGISFVLVIMISGLFRNLKLTRIITIASSLLLILGFILPPIDALANSRSRFSDVIVLEVFLLVAYLFTLIIIKQGEEQESIMRENYNKIGVMERRLLTDQLTGLYNHTAFYHILTKQLEECVSMKHPISLVVVDIDNFKKVNDTYGHENGNEVLVALARLMLDICDPSVYLSRYGGEEFALIFSEYHDSQAKEVMEQIRVEFSKTGYTFLPAGGITFSCGIREYTKNMETPQMFFECADQAMYYAKKRGKNQSYILYNDINMQSECQKWRLREHKINQQLSEITNRYSGDY